MKPYNHQYSRMKTPALDNEKHCFCFFVFQHPHHPQHHQHPQHPQHHHQHPQHHQHRNHNDVKASEGPPWSENHSEINNNIGDSTHDSINVQYIIERRKAELNFKRSQREDTIKAKDCTRNPLLEIDNNKYYEAKEVTSLHNWKSSNIDGQHKYPPPSAPPGVFEDMNQMFHRVGIRFSNNHYERYSYHSDSSKDDVNIEAVGDAHLQRLHLACVEKMLKLDLDSDIKGTDSLSKLDNMMTPVTSSLVTPFLGSSQDIHGSIESNQCYQLIEVVSVALAYSEVLQLQGQTDKAVLVVEDAIEKLKKDMKDIEESNEDNNISYNWDVLDPNSEITAKKIDLLLESHKRLGPLYKVMGDFQNAEKHIRWFISLAENKSDKITDLAHAYSLLAVIFDGLDRLDDAFEADTRALELLETIKVLQRERDLKLNY